MEFRTRAWDPPLWKRRDGRVEPLCTSADLQPKAERQLEVSSICSKMDQPFYVVTWEGPGPGGSLQLRPLLSTLQQLMANVFLNKGLGT